MKRFLSVFAILAIAVPTMAQVTPVVPESVPVDTVSVAGTGRTNITPDRFSFSVGVQTVAKTVDEAVTENNQRVAAVIAALKRAGAAEGDIQTSSFNIWPQQDYSQGNLPRILGYQVSNTVSVRSKKIADAGRLLGVAIAAGVNTSSGINFEVSDPARGRDQGLRAAFEDAKARATLLAQAAGRTVGRAIFITEGTLQQPIQPPYPMARGAVAMESKAVADVPVESGTQEMTYTVSVTFELR